MGQRFGWHSGVVHAKDVKVQGDLYVQDDIVFSDVSAGVLGVTGGIDMSGTTSAIGIDLSGGTFSTGAIRLGDDDKLIFGAGNDASFEYDEDGTDNLRYDGADMIFDTATKLLFRDSALYINSADDGHLDLTADTSIDANAKISLDAAGGSASASGLLMGIGTSGDPAASSTADDKFIELRCKSTATSGDNRLLYMRYELGGASGGGECLRAFSKITAANGTARGAHISLDVDSAGSCSGLGAGVDAQIMAPDAALSGGTYAAQNIEWYAAGSSTDVSGVTESSFIRCSLGGDSTGAANIEDNAHLLVITGGSNASGNIVGAAGDEPTWTSKTHLIRCKLNGTVAYLVAVQL